MTHPSNEPLLSVRDLRMHFPITKGPFNRVVGHVKAVDGVDFDLYEGECLGLVGESGSGKTTVGRCILRGYAPTSGSIRFRANGHATELVGAPREQVRRLRQHMQMIFQDPYSSLNPRMTVLDLVGEPLLCNGVTNRNEREDRVRELLVRVGLKPDHLLRYPHAFSGGQRQRIGIARALALNPKLIIADEPVSALDVSVQAQVLNLLMELQQEFGLTYLLVAHDLSVVRHISDRVAVMYVGKLVELAPVDQLFEDPRHPYTQALMSAVPVADPKAKWTRKPLRGEIADPGNPPPGCLFHPRCPNRSERCTCNAPLLKEIMPGRYVRCHRAEEMDLQTGL